MPFDLTSEVGLETKSEQNDSPMLDQATKDKLLHLGQSLDSKQFSDALGFIDLRKLLKCFAKAVSRHVDFSKGYLFLEDMRKSATFKNKLKFTYNQNKEMKIDLERLKKKANQNKKDKDLKSKELSACSVQPIGTEPKEDLMRDKISKGSQEDGTKRKTDIQKLAKYEITLSDSVYLDATVKGNTLLTETNRFEAENKLKSSFNPAITENVPKDATYDMSSSLMSSNVFNLSNDSTVKMTESLISSFVTTFDNKSMMSGTLGDSMAYSNTILSLNKHSSSVIPMEVIKSESGDSSSKDQCEEDAKDEESDDLEDRDDIDRFEEIDVKEVSIDSFQQSSKKRKIKALLSPEEIEEAHKERDVDLSRSTQVEYAIQCKDFIESGKYNLDAFKQAMGENLYESMEIFNVTTKEGFNSYIETQMLKFHPNYDFDLEQMVDKDMCKSSLALVDTFVRERPLQEEIYYYSKYIVISSRMEKEIPLMALAYIERLCAKIGILINHWNWRRIVLITLIVASKIWDDESLENVHFPKAMPDLSVKEISNLEKIFLDLISYDLIVKGADYAKYYFILRAMSKEFEEEECLQMDPISFDQMRKLQKNSDRAEECLREIYKYQDFSASI